MTASPKTYGELIAALNQIGIVCLQLESAGDAIPYHIQQQSVKVMRWVNACTDSVAHYITDATVRKLGRKGIDFHDQSRSMVVRDNGRDEYAPTVMARLMFGHLALIEQLASLKKMGIGPRAGKWKEVKWQWLDETAGALLRLLCVEMPQYEERAFVLAAKMTEAA